MEVVSTFAEVIAPREKERAANAVTGKGLANFTAAVSKGFTPLGNNDGLSRPR